MPLRSLSCLLTLVMLTAAGCSSAPGKPSAALVDRTADLVEQNYVDPDTADATAAYVKTQSEAGSYDELEGKALAAALTEDLQTVTQDKHLMVVYSRDGLPDFMGTTSPEARRAYEARAAREQGGLTRVELLEGNVGLVEIVEFYDPALARPAIDAAMARLAPAEALVFDLRRTRGGEPATVAYLLSYLLEEPTVLNEIHWRVNQQGERDVIDRLETEALPAGAADAQRPVYVLTSRRTFSAGEEFAYDLKHLDRATVIGEVTGGGANPSVMYSLTDQFAVSIPTGRAVNPVTGGNWEGTGVQPDVQVPAQEALQKALELARQH